MFVGICALKDLCIYMSYFAFRGVLFFILDVACTILYRLVRRYLLHGIVDYMDHMFVFLCLLLSLGVDTNLVACLLHF
jgi:hypothetical protein